MLKTLAHASLSLAAVLFAGSMGSAQQVGVVPDAPGAVGHGTQGWIVYRGVPFPPWSGYFLLCDDGSVSGNLVSVGEVAEDVHMVQGGDLASISFTFRVRSQIAKGGPPSGTATAILSVYSNDAEDTLLPSEPTRLGRWPIPVEWENDWWQVVTYDIPVPILVPQDLWVGVELVDLPAGTAGSLAGKGTVLGDDPEVQVGRSDNVTWLGPSPCESGGRLVDNAYEFNIIGNYAVDVRVFPVVDCPSPVANGDFETGTFAPWSATGRAGVVTAEQVEVAPASGAYQAGITSGDETLDVNGGYSLPGLTGTAVDVGSLETFLGVAPGTLAGLAVPGQPVEGSALKQTLTVNAGDTLHLRWNFLTNELLQDAFYNDFAFLTIVSEPSKQLLFAGVLADTFSPDLDESTSVQLNETGYRDFDYQFSGSGTYTLGIGVVDQNDEPNLQVHSSLLVDCVQREPGPVLNQPPSCTADLTAARAEFLEVSPGSFVVTECAQIVVPFEGSDPDGDVLTVDFTGLPPGASLSPLSGEAPLPSTFTWKPKAGDKAGAPYTLTVTFRDPSQATSSCAVTIADVNLRPICTVQDVITECTSPAGAEVTLMGSASDADDAAGNLIYTWFVAGNGVVLDDPSSPTPTGLFPIGVTDVTLCVADGRGGVSRCRASVTVTDTVAPEIVCTTDVDTLWPPKHGLHGVTLVVTATDTCTSPPTSLPITVRVSSSEPDNAAGSGDGNTVGDVDGQDGYTAPVDVTSSFSFDAQTGQWTGTLLLRAEREGTGTGRKYTIDVSAMDNAGNSATTRCCVVVPHDRRKSATP